MKKNLLLFMLLFATTLSNAQYCVTSLYTSGCGLEHIGNVTTTGGLTNINNTTGCTGGTGAAVYTQTHTTSIGMTVNYSITNGSSCCGENFKIFVDWNADNDWVDPGEDVANFTLAALATGTGSFVVPSTASIGTTRMRVRLIYGGTSAAITPCTQTTYGEAEDYNFVITSPCVGPSGLNATNITSSTATVSWIPPSPSVGSDYVVTTSATPPATGFTTTTASTGNVTGLTPSTLYYLYVRNKCSASSFSAWTTYQFTTLPPCYPPTNFQATNLLPTSATLNWSPWASALSYDYLVDQNRNDPTSSTGLTNTLLTTAPANGLTENTKYYVHIRSRCALGQMSNWSLDSFTTPIPCRPPNISISHINTDEAVAYWAPVPTALYYDYAVTTSSTPPALGTKYMYTSLHTSALHDGKEYFIHVRSHCNSIGVEGTSDWGTASFKTFPTSVANMNKESFIEAYPNPVSGVLNINLNDAVKGNGTITVTDISGKALRTAGVNSSKTTIDLTDLAKGVYLLKYTDDTHNEIIRITKQ